MTSLTAEHDGYRPGSRPGPPVGQALVAFTVTIVALLLFAGADVAGSLDVPVGTASQFGVVATTTFAIAGMLAAYRALAIRNGWAAAIGAVLLGPGAAWSWLTFVAGGPAPQAVNSLVVLSGGGMAIVLLARGLRRAHWLEVFGGLGSLGLGMVAVLVRLDPAATGTASPALLAAVAGMTCLYGLLVDVEVAEHRSLIELIESRERIEEEVSRVEDLLHDLRSGLLAIETAVGSFDDDVAAPLRAEAARLRRLTLTGARTIELFDLADRVRNLVAARRVAGVPVTLRGPEQATAWAEESEVLAIVDNLVTNAERHGHSGPILVEIAGGDVVTRVSVSSRGQLPAGDPEAIFRRGVTTHPHGRGLGLARARMLAVLNGAELQVSPAQAGHTTFVLTLRSRPPVAVA
ncbi:MAG: HAMP domain-containing histidine kinase [Acidimicrobiia bacterium]|nr:HAMP domain-containing histidine kinase [Acidimicrobiia bacterium]